MREFILLIESKDFDEEDDSKSRPAATLATDKWAGEDEADDIKVNSCSLC